MAATNDPRGAAHVDAVRAASAALLDAAGAHRVSVWVHDERAGVVSPLVAVGADVPSTPVARRWSRLPIGELGRMADVLQHRTPVLVDDVNAPDIPTALCRDFGMTSGWVAPLLIGEQSLGLLVVEPVSAAAAGMQVHLASVAGALAEARAWYLADRRQAELDLLLELTRTSVEPGGAGGAIEHLCRRLAHELGVRRACVFLAEDGELVAAHAYNADGSVDLEGFRAFAEASSLPPIVEAAFRTWRTMVVDEPSPDLLGDWWRDRFGIGSGAAVPIGTAEEPMGVLTLDDPQPRRFTERVVVLAEAAAAHFGLLYERARLLDEHARGLRSAAAVRRLLREGSRAQSPIEAVEIAARIGRDALEAEHACAFLLDDHGVIDGVVTVGIEEPWRSEVRRRFHGLRAADLPLGRAVMSGRKPVVVADTSSSDLVSPELLEELPVRSYVAIPLATSGHVRGSVVFTASRQQRRWSRGDRDLIDQLMLECELVLENAALREWEAARTSELTWRALHDPLTQLPNRALIGDRLSTALRATSRRGGEVAVLFIDLCGFKQVNDDLGHEAGDLVLVELASRFAGALRPGDTVGRLAGDEFAVILPETTPEEAATVASRICDVTQQPLAVAGHTVLVGASIGIALGHHADTARALLSRADAAMYRAKHTCGHGYALAPGCALDGDEAAPAPEARRAHGASPGEAPAPQDAAVRAARSTDMHLSVTGTGPPVVLTHGFGDSSATFDAQPPVLAGLRTCRWDLPGHGRSGVGPLPSSRASALAWLDAAIAAAGPGPAVLVGHSLGGYLSLCRTVLEPSGVAGLVLIASGPGFRDPAKRQEWNDLIARFARRRGIPADAHGICEQPDSVVLDRLGTVDVPVLVVVGGEDHRYHAGSRLIAHEVPHGELLVVDGAGHFPHRTHADQVNRHLSEFLAQALAT